MPKNKSSTDLLNHFEERLELLSTPSTQRPPIPYLVFEGGGVKGVIYPGVIQGLEAHFLMNDVKEVAGSSAGGIIATLLAVGYTGAELEDKFQNEINFNEFLDHRTNYDPKFIKLFGLSIGLSNLYHLFTKGGLYKGEVAKNLSKNLIERKLEEKLRSWIALKSAPEHREQSYLELLKKHNISDLGLVTFGQLKSLSDECPELQIKRIHLTGTRMSNAQLKMFSDETDPDMPIVDALRITMSLPYIYETPRYEGNDYMDGGLADNYPMFWFNQEKYLKYGINESRVNPCTLGILVESQAEIDNRWGGEEQSIVKPKSSVSFFTKMLNHAHWRSEHLDKYDINSLQVYDNDIDTTEFNITQEKKKKAFEVGREAIESYIQLYMDKKSEYKKTKTYENSYQKYYTMDLAQVSYAYDQLQVMLDEIDANKDRLGEGYQSLYNRTYEHLMIAGEILASYNRLPKKSPPYQKAPAHKHITLAERFLAVGRWFKPLIESKFVQYPTWLLFKLLPFLIKTSLNMAITALKVAIRIAHVPLFTLRGLLEGLFYKKHKISQPVRDWMQTIHVNATQENTDVHQKLTAFLNETKPSQRLKREKQPPIENLVLNGCGITAVGYLGAYQEMERLGMLKNLKRIAGCSMSGVVATLLALGCKPSDIALEFSYASDLADPYFSYDPTLVQIKGHRLGVSSLISLFRNKSIYRGDALKKRISEMMSQQIIANMKLAIWSELPLEEREMAIDNLQEHHPNLVNERIDDYLQKEVDACLKGMKIHNIEKITFKELNQLSMRFASMGIKDIYLGATRLSNGTLRVFSHENDPNMPVIDAVRMSMSFPGLLQPVEFEGDVYGDGIFSDPDCMPVFDEPQYLSHGLNQAYVNPCTWRLLMDSNQQMKDVWGDTSPQHEKLNMWAFTKKQFLGIPNRVDRLNTNSLHIPDLEIDDFDIGAGNFANVVQRLMESGIHTVQEHQHLYNGDDVLYDTRANYSNAQHRFYSKEAKELERIANEELVSFYRKTKELEEAEGLSSQERTALNVRLSELKNEAQTLSEALKFKTS